MAESMQQICEKDCDNKYQKQSYFEEVNYYQENIWLT